MNKFTTGIEDYLKIGKEQMTRNMEFIKYKKHELQEYRPSEIFKNETEFFELIYTAKIKEYVYKSKLIRNGTYTIRKFKL